MHRDTQPRLVQEEMWAEIEEGWQADSQKVLEGAIPNLISTMVLERGLSMDAVSLAGEARIALFATLVVIEVAANLKFKVVGEKVHSRHAGC